MAKDVVIPKGMEAYYNDFHFAPSIRLPSASKIPRRYGSYKLPRPATCHQGETGGGGTSGPSTHGPSPSSLTAATPNLTGPT